jgi:hypothetical protein
MKREKNVTSLMRYVLIIASFSIFLVFGATPSEKAGAPQKHK